MKLLFCAALAFAAPASAGTLVHEFSFARGGHEPFNDVAWNSPAFDPALGTLTGARLDLSVVASVQGTGDCDAFPLYHIDLDLSGGLFRAIDLDAGASHYLESRCDDYELDEYYEVHPLFGEDSHEETFDYTDLTLAGEPGGVFAFLAYGWSDSGFSGGDGVFAVNGLLRLTYTYEAPIAEAFPAAVPLPGAGALLLAGLGLLAWRKL